MSVTLTCPFILFPRQMQVIIIVNLSQHATEDGVKTTLEENLPPSSFSLRDGSIYDDEEEAISK